jgi:GNAT superfamily N-acetyltransferase
MTEHLTIADQGWVPILTRGLRKSHPTRNRGDRCREARHRYCRALCRLDEPAYRRLMTELRATDTPRPCLSDQERSDARAADEGGEFCSLDSRIGRLADARDAAVTSLAELRARPDARPQDIRAWEVQLASYESELVDLRLDSGRPLADLLTFSEGGDALGREYLGYIVARIGEEEMGRLDYTYFKGELGIRYVEVQPDRRGRGLATALLDRLRCDEPLAEVFSFGDVLSAEGRAWAEHHEIERWR